MRLNKYLALCGVGSRRRCDELIESGQVFVNGQVATLGLDVSDNDNIVVNGNKISATNDKVYYVLNKPKGCVTTLKDDRGRQTVIDIFNQAYTKQFKNRDIPKVFPVGRLDYNTQGLLLLTNDGDFANSLMHPNKKINKTYRAVVYPKLSTQDIVALQNGVIIDNIKTLPCFVNVIKDLNNKQIVEITISQGRNRQVRKMFESVGKYVDDLERVAIGSFVLKDLARGQIREITPKERELLYR